MDLDASVWSWPQEGQGETKKNGRPIDSAPKAAGVEAGVHLGPAARLRRRGARSHEEVAQSLVESTNQREEQHGRSEEEGGPNANLIFLGKESSSLSFLVAWGLVAGFVLVSPMRVAEHRWVKRLLFTAANLRTFAHYVFVSVMIPTAYEVAAHSPHRAAVSGLVERFDIEPFPDFSAK